MQSYGITGDLLHWLDDYVSDRKQKVVVNNECSNPNTVKAGVPQGSVLGPLLFLLYINDITDNLGSLARLFADDTSLSYFGRNYDIMKSDINNDLSKLNEWAKLWLVDFNPKKTKALVISTSAVPHLDLRFNGEPVEIVKTHKHLGLTFASDGNWTNHIDNIVNAAFKQVNVLRKLKCTLSKQTLSNIYLTFIRPTLEYACEVWDGCFEREVAKLEKVQLESARIVTGLPKFASRDSLYYETGWEPLSCRRKSRKLTTFYKMHNKVCPQYLCNCLPPTVSSISDHNLRNNENYTTPRSRLRMSLTSFIPSTVSIWNNLDLNVRNSPNISCFKSRIKEKTVKSPEYYGEGSRKLSILHARLRHQCSSLNSDLYRINITNDPKCQCGSPYEDSIHYLMECPLYQNERYCLFRNLRETNKNIETLLFGNDENSINENSNIFNKVRAYIRQIKRF